MVDSSGAAHGLAAAIGSAVIYACICFALSERDVRDQIRAGARTLDALARACRAGSDCSGCKQNLLRLIADENAGPQTSARGQ